MAHRFGRCFARKINRPVTSCCWGISMLGPEHAKGDRWSRKTTGTNLSSGRSQCHFDTAISNGFMGRWAWSGEGSSSNISMAWDRIGRPTTRGDPEFRNLWDARHSPPEAAAVGSVVVPPADLGRESRVHSRSCCAVWGFTACSRLQCRVARTRSAYAWRWALPLEAPCAWCSRRVCWSRCSSDVSGPRFGRPRSTRWRPCARSSASDGFRNWRR